jgi:hypothetical protein
MSRISHPIPRGCSYRISRAIETDLRLDSGPTSTTFDKKVPNSASDGFHTTTTAPYGGGDTYAFDNSATTLKIGYQAVDNIGFQDGYTWIAFARIADLPIPQGATITSAKLHLHHSTNSNAASKTLVIDAEASDNTSSPSVESNIRSATKTTATVNWTLPSTIGSTIYTPEIKTVVQEVVDRAGWASGNAMTFFFHTPETSADWNLTGRTYDLNMGQAPHIEITYSS